MLEKLKSQSKKKMLLRKGGRCFSQVGDPHLKKKDPLSLKIIEMMPQQIKPLANVYDDDSLADLTDQHRLLELVPVELDLPTGSSSTSERE